MNNFIKTAIFIIFFITQCWYAEARMINKVVAIVNDEVITQQDVDQLLAVLYAQYSQVYTGDELLKKMEEAKKDILKQVIEDKLVLSRAKELGIKITEQEINERLEYIKKGFPSEEEFDKTLETQGITVSTLKDRYRDQIMMKKLVDFEVRSRIMVLPSEISEYYEKHRQEFKKNERYKVKNILIKANDEMGFELARVEIGNIYTKLKEGQNFDELAKAHSQGPNSAQGGDLGYIERGQMLEELDRVIFVLKPGEFSEPVKSNLGYHIFKVEDITSDGYRSLEEAQNDIQLTIFQNKFKAKVDEWLNDLKSKAYICIK